MTFLLVLGAAFAGLAAALAMRAAAAGRMRQRTLLAQVGLYGFTAAPSAGESARPWFVTAAQRLATWVGQRLEERIDEARRRRIRRVLNAAGFYRTSVTRYLGYRAVAGVFVPVVFFGLFITTGSLNATTFVLVLALVGVGAIGPTFYLDRRAANRVGMIDYEIPELVDLLVTTVEAGVGFVAALQLAARRVRDPLGQELRVTLREQGMGLTLDEALGNLGARTDSGNLRMFTQAVLQGETLGVSIGKILRDLATDMRKRRRQMAEERAQKAPIKLLFPLIMLILPAMFIVLLGPAVFIVIRQLGG